MKTVFFLFFAMLIVGCGFPFSCEEFQREHIKPGKVAGWVVEKKKMVNRDCFGEIIVKAQGRFDTLKYLPTCNGVTQREVWTNVNVGDSIFKAAGENTVVIINNSGKKVLEISCLAIK
ncbi:hypothetical protein [Chitinophaga eiseniae]|uniref:Lipoprotein n=1 Tax=Chitinophaga eiseniae TaxID=634771 RepID=A0A847SJ17_9BACT|nr:hypothetical protein [Chitinophaga eiseniae]NLR77356.1 hypothetical protein [Chitinophaga eiseniae]